MDPMSAREPAAPIKPGDRIRSTDYGRGTVVGIGVGSREVHVQWDEPWLKGVALRVLIHDLTFIETQTEPIHEDTAGKNSLPNIGTS